MECTLETWITFPDVTENQTSEKVYQIGENTEFYSIVNDGYKYFFVTDLPKFRVMNGFESEDPDLLRYSKTDIVFPISYRDVFEENVVGFLCLTSPQKWNNTKINKEIISLLNAAASLICKYMIEKQFPLYPIPLGKRRDNNDKENEADISKIS